MAIKLTQSLKQTQNLMMTPQLQQAIKLLTVTHLEMKNVIASEMVENPMLEEIEVDDTAQQNEEDYKVENLEMQNQEAASDSFNEDTIMPKDDFDWGSYIDSYNSTTYQPSMVSYDPDEIPNYENIVSKGQTLPEHLEWQLRMENLSEIEWEVGQRIIHNINDDGYLEQPFEEILANTQIDRENGLYILDMVQRLDPVGCGAQNLQDCLLAQARIMEERSPLLEKIIINYLPDLQNRNYEKISKETGVSISAIKTTALILQDFHPRPGRLISPADTVYVDPDIFVIEVGGEFVVHINDEGVPRLKVSNLYRSMLAKGKGNNESSSEAEAKEYVQDKLRSAMWLIKSIQNRQKTIYKVSKAIVKEQQNFFKKGPEFLKPMVLKDIAQEIGMHESTVSRVTTNKYMHSPIGVFELKYFFNAGVGGKDGGVDVAGEVLKGKIKRLIDNENPAKPLSDQKIVELLGREDIKIARRTVAKYREMMGVLSSSKRKEKK